MRKNIALLLILVIFVTACTKNNGTATTPLNEMLPDSGAVATGIFMNGPHGTVTGKAAVVVNNGSYSLALEDVMISRGPDLHVYLSKELQPVNFIDLGKLKSTAGNQLYTISGAPDITQYKYALVHCQQYNHLFGSAVLK
jgi:Electron transfer DM13